MLHRLNRTEYANAIEDLLGLKVDVASMLPPDDSAFGFDNNAGVLGLSPVLLERYLAAADRISALALADPSTEPGSEIYRARQDLSQDQHIEGLPFGTVGGMQVEHTFPLDAEYEIRLSFFRNNLEIMRGIERRAAIVGRQPQLLLALASKAPLRTLDVKDPVDAKQFFAQLSGELAQSRTQLSATTRYLLLTN